MPEIKVLFATSEVAPLIKTGGLADVSGALPAALRAINVDVRVLVPGYPQVMEKMGPHEVVANFPEILGFPPSTLIFSIMGNGVPLLVLDCPMLYQRTGGPYADPTGHDWLDNPVRFGLLSKIAAVLGSRESPLRWHPDLVHCNDWQTGLTGVYLSVAEGAVPNIITIHNLAFQGNFSPRKVQMLHLPPTSFNVNGVELYGNMSFLKAGLYYAYHITTVSPTYAQEIQGETLGFGLQGLLHSRSEDVTGILNGIDTDEWNPESDKYLDSHFGPARMAGKDKNKLALQNRMGLKPEADVPLLGVVSRFTHQKGLDLLLEIAPRLLKLPVQLVMLGSGDPVMQKTARALAQKFPGKIAATVGFDEGLSHQIEAGADMFIMPSRFEPCGLNQFYSQRYGTPPIVNNTGGLADSVVDCTPQTLKAGTASGFVLKGMTADDLFDTIQRAVELYHDQKKWKVLRKNCMTKDFSWETSARAYREVYMKVLGRIE
ncbi:MAG: starch synthase [Gallionellaceae bacterium CG1_02_56_997]|nr:MAG: starch synthase [Gallionellaceae bacterium CG1_02_56_997]